MARRLNTTPKLVRRVLRDAVDPKMQFRTRKPGRPAKEIYISKAMMDWLRNPAVLSDQVGYTLAARTLIFNRHFGTSLTRLEFRGLYAGAGVTR